MKYFRRFLQYSLLMLAVSCTDDEKPADTGRQYFPLKTGTYQVYGVNETTYTLGKSETKAYQLKVKIVDRFLSVAGDSIFVIHRSRRNTGSDPWTIIDTWSARADNREAVISEGNIAYVKLKFPVQVGSRWNGNAYNTQDEDDYVLNSKSPATIQDKTFEDCITVVQSDNKDYIVFLDERTETYARGVGLISRETTQLQYCTAVDCLGKQQVESGIISKQVIQEYGVE